jgi:hypothetical protein
LYSRHSAKASSAEILRFAGVVVVFMSSRLLGLSRGGPAWLQVVSALGSRPYITGSG